MHCTSLGLFYFNLLSNSLESLVQTRKWRLKEIKECVTVTKADPIAGLAPKDCCSRCPGPLSTRT